MIEVTIKLNLHKDSDEMKYLLQKCNNLPQPTVFKVKNFLPKEILGLFCKMEFSEDEIRQVNILSKIELEAFKTRVENDRSNNQIKSG